MEASFLELRCKEVINVVDGKRLGHIVDLIFDLKSSCIAGIVVPGNKSFWNVFKNETGIFIPYNQICKIGEETILVELYGTASPSSNIYTLQQPTNKQNNKN